MDYTNHECCHLNFLLRTTVVTFLLYLVTILCPLFETIQKWDLCCGICSCLKIDTIIIILTNCLLLMNSLEISNRAAIAVKIWGDIEGICTTVEPFFNYFFVETKPNRWIDSIAPGSIFCLLKKNYTTIKNAPLGKKYHVTSYSFFVWSWHYW